MNALYGSVNSVDDHLSRVSSLQISGAGTTLVDYTYMGVAWQVRVGYPEPAVELTYKKKSSEPIGDAGDPYNGYDRFGRSVDLRWQKTTTGNASLDCMQYGFDRDSRRTWAKRTLTIDQDQAHTYDGLSQVINAARGNLNLNSTAIAGVPAFNEAWDYDPTGNWVGYRQSGSSGSVTLDQRRVHDQGNRLTQVETNGIRPSVVLDRVGRMLDAPPGPTGLWDSFEVLTWDAWSRLVVSGSGAFVSK